MSNSSESSRNELKAQRRGDTWQGIGSITVVKNEMPLDITGASIVMQLRRRPKHGVIVASWSTDDGSILFLDPGAGKFEVVGRRLEVPAALYYWDIEITLAADADYPDGRRMTIAQGVWTILQDVTR